jgi:hypothetical protein
MMLNPKFSTGGTVTGITAPASNFSPVTAKTK